jgi:hypothetical protein
VTDTVTAGPGTRARGDLEPTLVAGFLRHLGLPGPVPVTPDGLAALYREWSARVPYDNLLIRRSLLEHPGEKVVGVPPERLLADNIAYGNASQCSETAEALDALLRALGFETTLCLAAFGNTNRLPLMVNHITNVVAFGDEWYLADTVLLSGTPLPLRDHQAVYPPLPYTISRTGGAGWRIDTVTPVAGTPVSCQLMATAPDPGACETMYHNVQDAGFAAFNSAFYAKQNVYGEMVTFSCSDARPTTPSLHRTTLAGKTTTVCETAAAQERVLTEVFGFSPELIARIPPNGMFDG